MPPFALPHALTIFLTGVASVTAGIAASAQGAGTDPAPEPVALPSGPLEPAESSGDPTARIHAREAGVAEALPISEASRLLLRAGRSIPPGLTVAQRNARVRDAAEALGELSARLASSYSVWSETFEAILRTGASGNGSESEVRLWNAAATAIGSLGESGIDVLLPEVDMLLGAALAEPPESRRRAAAAGALHRLYGLWFEDPTDFEVFRTSLCTGEGTERLLKAQREAQYAQRELLVALLPHDPGRAKELLNHPDPELRSAAARALGEARASEGSEVFARPDRFDSANAPDETLDLLFERLRVDPSATVQSALWDALSSVLTSDAREQLPGLRTRMLDELERLVRVAAPDTGLFLAKGLSHLAAEAPDDAATGPGRELLLLAELLRPIAARTIDEPDVDVFVGMLDAVQAQHSRLSTVYPGEAGLASAVEVDAVRMAVHGLFADAAQPGDVRLAALRAYASLAGANHVPLLIDALCEERSQRIAFAAINALQPLIASLEPTSGDGRRLLDCVVAQLATGDAVLRRRVLSFLAEPGLGSWLNDFEPSILVAQLDVEKEPDLREALLVLLHQLAGEDMPSLLELESFEELASGDPKTLADLFDAIVPWVGDDPVRCMAAARRLAGAEDRAHPARLQRALQLVASLSTDAVREWTPEEHLRVLKWTSALRASGLRVVDVASDGDGRSGGAFLDRLLAEHLPASANAESENQDAADVRFFRAALLARLSVDRWNQTTDVKGIAAVEEAFATALEVGGGPERVVEKLERVRLRRDLARFLSATGDRDQNALALYRALLDWERVGDRSGAVLELSDLRATAELLARVEGAPGADSPDARGAFDVGRDAILRERWAGEPAAVRLRDLSRLVDWAVEAQDIQRLELLDEWLADERQPQPDGSGERTALDPSNEPADAVGRGVGIAGGLGPERAEELSALRARVRAALAEGAQQPEPELPPPSPAPAAGDS